MTPFKSTSFKQAAVLVASLVSVCIPWSAQASDGSTSCYKIDQPDTPERSRTVTRRAETWCYRKLATPKGSVFVFNKDGKRVLPELAFMLDPDGVMTHGSLLGGKVTVHRVKTSQFNPFSVPLSEPAGTEALLLPSGIDAAIEDSAKEVLDLFSRGSAETADFSLTDNGLRASARASHLPWRGYWWPYKNFPMGTPLKKYDAYVQARTGSSPRASAWEASHHRYQGTWWEGHCNGWASSAILRREPRSPAADSQSGVTFSVSDQKGLLAEIDFCTRNAFFGSRNRGSGDSRDIYPAVFHKTLLYYLGQLGKPIAIDYRPDSAVDNHIISGYQMTTSRSGSNSYVVNTTLTIHKYDGKRTDTPGVAPSYTRTYRYNLRVDSSGNPIGGSWLSGNPDFLWVPLGFADCGSKNQRLSADTVRAITGS